MEYSKLDLFLGAFPRSGHELDRRRFLEYALEGAAEGKAFARQRFEACGKLTPAEIDEYEQAYSWICTLMGMPGVQIVF